MLRRVNELFDDGCCLPPGAIALGERSVGIVLDREKSLPVVMASSEGGMDIEEVAASTPEKILKAAYDPAEGLSEDQAAELSRGMGIPEELVPQSVEFLLGLARLYTEKDCSLAEINPLVTTNDGKVRALDAKINFDSNAMFRHDAIVALVHRFHGADSHTGRVRAVVAPSDLELAGDIRIAADLHGLDPGAVDPEWHLVLGFARRGACVAPDAGARVDEEAVVHVA